MLKNYLKNNWWRFIIVFAILSIDMLTKFLIVKDGVAPIDIIDGVLSIYPSKNYGAGFSVLSGQRWLLIIFTIIFLVALIIFDIMYKKKSKLLVVASGLIIAGAIGNLVDRVFFGYVRDFIYFEIIDFPIFNIADISLTFGVILFAIYILFFTDKGKNRKSDEKNSQLANSTDERSSDKTKTVLSNTEKSENEEKKID